MINLTEIIKDNENLRMMKKYGASAKKVAAQLLKKKGLEEADYFILRIKEMPKYGHDWVASYRSNTVMSGRPIFWINVHLPEIMKDHGVDTHIVRIMTDNILHEWWHAICEAFRIAQFRNVPLKTKVSPRTDQKEEDDAELFISYCGGDAWRNVTEEKAKYFEHAIQEFNGLWR